MKRQIQAGNKILLDTQFPDVEGVAEIFGMHQQVDLFIYRDRHFSGDDVIF